MWRHQGGEGGWWVRKIRVGGVDENKDMKHVKILDLPARGRVANMDLGYPREKTWNMSIMNRFLQLPIPLNTFCAVNGWFKSSSIYINLDQRKISRANSCCRRKVDEFAEYDFGVKCDDLHVEMAKRWKSLTLSHFFNRPRCNSHRHICMYVRTHTYIHTYLRGRNFSSYDIELDSKFETLWHRFYNEI